MKDDQAKRLVNRAAEVRERADRLAHARRSFKHVQYASATLRREDNSAYQARIARNEQEAATLRAYHQESREALSYRATSRSIWTIAWPNSSIAARKQVSIPVHRDQ